MKSSVLRFERHPQKSMAPSHLQPASIGAALLDSRAPFPTLHDLDQPAPSAEKAASRHVSPEIATASLEGMPHLLEKIERLWRTRDLNTFIARLFLDSRDGDRAGFPIEIARELVFLSRLNLLVRAEEAAPVLGIHLSEAVELIARGDQMALGHASSADDIWSVHVANNAPLTNTAAVNTEYRPKTAIPLVRLASPKLSAYLRDTPPLPPVVKLDITTPKALRSARGGFEAGGVMEKGLFRCLAKELSGLQIEHLTLSSLGDTSQADWLPSGIRFTRMHCKFRKVALLVDLLSTPEKILRQCIHEGAGQVVIFLNLTSGKWRAKVQEILANDPDYFRREMESLITFRDIYAARSGMHCELSVAAASRRGLHNLNGLYTQLSTIPGLVPYQEILLPAGITAREASAKGRCHCLAPFIEAHVRTNGHLVACAQDHSGYSFTADLARTTFTDAWLSQAFRMTRLRVARGEQAGRLCDICPHHQPLH